MADLLHGGGDQSFSCSPRPLVVQGLADVADVVAGGDTTCARDASGRVSCWGRNDGGLVGDGSTASRAAPTPVALPAPAKDIAMSDTHACALLADATVACWGVGFDGQLGFPAAPSGDVDMRGELSVIASKPERVVGVAGAKGVFVGSRVTCIRTSSGEVTCFGLVGLGDSGADLRVPRTTFPDLAGAKDLFLGSGTHCAVLAEGTSCWGASATGPLSAPNQGGVGWSKLVRASTIDAPRALAITFGRACAVGQDGLVTCFGYDGRDRSAPRVVAGLTNVVAIGVGASHVCALDQAGAVSCWGGTASGQVGRIEGPRISPLFGEVHTIPLP